MILDAFLCLVFMYPAYRILRPIAVGLFFVIAAIFCSGDIMEKSIDKGVTRFIAWRNRRQDRAELIVAGKRS